MTNVTSVLKRHEVLIFCVLTLGLSFATYFLPFPPEARALGFSMVVVFIPVSVATLLTALTQGWRAVLALLAQALHWRMGWRRLLQIIALCLAVRFGVNILAFLFGWVPDLQIGEFSPFLIMVYIFAAGEELGWRGFALPRLLKQHSPLAASLMLGLPWATLHLILLLPGMLSEGAPPIAQFTVILALSILLTWAYQKSGSSGVCAAILLHGTQNLLAFLNAHVEVTQATWLMAVTYSAAAILLVVIDSRVWQRTPIPETVVASSA